MNVEFVNEEIRQLELEVNQEETLVSRIERDLDIAKAKLNFLQGALQQSRQIREKMLAAKEREPEAKREESK